MTTTKAKPTTYTATFPDGTTYTRKSHHTYTHAWRITSPCESNHKTKARFTAKPETATIPGAGRQYPRESTPAYIARCKEWAERTRDWRVEIAPVTTA